MEAYEHINLNEVDTSIKAIEPNVYTLEVNKLDPVYRTIKNPASVFAGQTVLVLRGSFTIVDDDNFSGRKVWQDFWTNFDGAKKDLKRILTATGVEQPEGMSLTDWAAQFANLNPPARFKAPITKEANKQDPTAGPVNRINFIQSRVA